MLDRSGFLINSHDPLRVHVLKHIRQNSLTCLRSSVADDGNLVKVYPAQVFVCLLIEALQLESIKILFNYFFYDSSPVPP